MTPGFIEDLVEREVERWQERARATDLPYSRRPGQAQGPVVAFSRQHGAEGARIAQTVAQRLDFSYYDREIVDEMASTAHMCKAVVESVDERGRNWISDWIADFFGGERLSRNEYARHLSTVLLSLAWHGRAVIVGRGACFLLDPAWTLRVRAWAPFEARVARVAATHHLSMDEARVHVAKNDRERSEFVRRNFDRDQGDPVAFDLAFDTSSLPLETCTDLVLIAFKARFG